MARADGDPLRSPVYRHARYSMPHGAGPVRVRTPAGVAPARRPCLPAGGRRTTRPTRPAQAVAPITLMSPRRRSAAVTPSASDRAAPSLICGIRAAVRTRQMAFDLARLSWLNQRSNTPGRCQTASRPDPRPDSPLDHSTRSRAAVLPVQEDRRVPLRSIGRSTSIPRPLGRESPAVYP